MFVIGLVVLALAVPAVVGAIFEGRTPTTVALLVLIGGGLVGVAVYQRPGFYSISTVPDVFVRVVGQYLN